MSVLRSIEQKIEALFEGVFGRAFRTNVQPVELARKLAKEMDDHRIVSVSRVYVPNEYTVYLSPDDREQFEGYEASLRRELEEYLAEHARREGYALLSPPTVLLETDDDLAIGEFGIATRMVQPERAPAASRTPEPAQVEPGATMIYRPTAPAADRGRRRRGARASSARSPTLDVGRATRRELDKRRVVLGRSRDATSRSTTRTCRAGTPRCGRRARRTGSSTSTRRTAIEVNGRRAQAREARATATRSRSARPSSSSPRRRE